MRTLSDRPVTLDRARRASCWAVVLVIGLNTTGCALLIPTPIPANATQSCLAEQDEIENLRQLLAEKETLIRSQRAQQKFQANELQTSTRQASRAQVKLTRLATQPDTASTLAEVEVAMETMQSTKLTARQKTLLMQAQRLLDAANAAYTSNDFVGAMSRATQASEMIEMAKGQRSGAASGARRTTVSFHSPIALHTRVDCNLRQLPNTGAAILDVLKQDVALSALAYRGAWMRVETDDGRSGWILSTLLESRPDAH